MTLQLFYSPHIILSPSLLLLLLLLLCVPMCTANDSPTTETVEIFKPEEKIQKILKTNGEKEKVEDDKEITVKNVKSPFLASVDTLMIAVAEVNYTEKGGGNEIVDVVARYTEMKSAAGDLGAMNIKNLVTDWSTQLVTQEKKKANVFSAVRSVVASEKNKAIYVLLVNNTAADSGKQSGELQWEFKIIEGSVSSEDKEKGKKMKWESKNSSITNREEFKQKLDDIKLGTFLSDNSGFLTAEGKVVFIVRGKTTDNNKNLTALIQLSDTKPNLDWLHVETTDNNEGCFHYFFPWGSKIMMISTFWTAGGKKKVMESTDMKVWNNSSGGFYRMWDTLKDKKDFTTATINEKTVVLFTHDKSSGGKVNIHLWMSDGNRLIDVGVIVNESDTKFYGSILHANGELFIMLEHNKNGGLIQSKAAFLLKHLKKTMNKSITFILDTWTKSDKIVQSLCGKAAATATNSCFSEYSTDGLVGFLSDSTNSVGNQMYWKNEYLYVNATVTEGTKVDNGFTFNNIGAGAKWLVGKINDDQPYNFTDSGFTLVATVTVDSVGKDNSVLGVVFTDKAKTNKRIGLLCANEGKWSVISNKGQTATTKNLSCEQGKSYKVTLTLKNNENGEGTMYVDGRKLSADGNDFKIKKGSENSFYFYFGADVNGGQSNDAESHVTVTNVLLYNRPFTENEVEKLKISKQEKPKESGDNSANHTDSQERTQGDRETTGGSSGGNGDNSDTTDKDTKITDMTSSPSQPEDSTVHEGVGGALLTLLLLFLSDVCVHALCDR